LGSSESFFIGSWDSIDCGISSGKNATIIVEVSVNVINIDQLCVLDPIVKDINTSLGQVSWENISEGNKASVFSPDLIVVFVH
jgi:hypothetical protein